MDPFERVAIGETGVALTRLGLGGGPLSSRPAASRPGALMHGATYADALATVGQAYALGVRYFDTAPFYGMGVSEVRVGRGLSALPRDDYVLSSKVGRLLVPRDGDDRRPPDRPEGLPRLQVRFDYSRAGILRSLEESLKRLELDRIDILYLHDADAEPELEAAALATALPTLMELREQGVVRAIGTGMNQWQMPARLIRAFDLDLVLLAGRYTLLDQSGLDQSGLDQSAWEASDGESFMDLCAARGVRVVVGGPYNSGILAETDLSGPVSFDYAEAGETWVEKARRIQAVCRRHGASMKAAALQFVLAHPVVAAVIPGAASVDELEENARLIGQPLPAALWAELKAEGLLPAEAATPMTTP